MLTWTGGYVEILGAASKNERGMIVGQMYEGYSTSAYMEGQEQPELGSRVGIGYCRKSFFLALT